MARKPAPEPDDPEQSERFIKAAREIGAAEDEETATRVFTQVAPAKPKGRPSPR